MDVNLIKARVAAFAWEAFSLILVAVTGVLSSDEFRALITEYTGETVFGSLALLVLAGIVKHLRNLSVLKKYERVGGASSEYDKPVLI